MKSLAREDLALWDITFIHCRNETKPYSSSCEAVIVHWLIGSAERSVMN